MIPEASVISLPIPASVMDVARDADAHTWNQQLYLLQQDAPSPYPLYCGGCDPEERNSPRHPESGTPEHSLLMSTCVTQRHGQHRDPHAVQVYGAVYHGALSREESQAMLRDTPSGAYLIRDSSHGPSGGMTLVIRYDELVKNFHLFYDPTTQEHFVGENRFERIHDLVADGLIHFYVETRGADVIAKLGNPGVYAQSPYAQERERYYTLKLRQGQSNTRPGLPLFTSPASAGRQPSPQLPPRRLPPPPPGGRASPHSSPAHPRQNRDTDTDEADNSTDISGTPHQPNPVAFTPRPFLPDTARFLQPTGRFSMIENPVSSPKASPPLPPAQQHSVRKEEPDTHQSQHGARLTPKAASVLVPASTSAKIRQHLSNNQLDTVDGGPTDSTSAPPPDISGKAHQFKQLTFAGAQWCELCAHFMWGLVRQGVRCQDCGLQAHKKCGESAPQDCIPDMKWMKRVFAVELTSLVLMERTQVPLVLVRLIQEIETRGGLKQSGLYRECGFTEHIDNLQTILNKDVQTADLSRYEDVNILTSLVKKFFKLLPIPLVPFDLYTPLMDLMNTPDSAAKVQAIRNLLHQMPPAHLRTMRYFMQHLQRVVDHRAQNRMTADNLGLIFSQTILRMPELSPAYPNTASGQSGGAGPVVSMSQIQNMMQRVQSENIAMKYLIEHQEELLQA